MSPGICTSSAAGAALALAGLAGLASAQLTSLELDGSPPGPAELGRDTSPPPAGIATRSFGVGRDADVLRGGGPDYRVEFGPEGMTFWPALPRTAGPARPLRFELVSIARGDETLLVAPPGSPPVLDGNRVSYDRGSGVTEHYDVLREGVAQSFRFEHPLAGSGDLVVSGRLHTTLPRPWTADAAGALRFDLPGIAGVTYGAVTGVDAQGRSAPGALRLVGDSLELRLPASFVDGAAYPLLLDPLIGSSFGLSTLDDSDPDVAYDESTSRWLVVWEADFGDIDIRGQLVSTSGALIGAMIPLDGFIATNAVNPTVANVNSTNRFFACWQDDVGFVPGDLIGRAVDAGTGGYTNLLTVASNAADEVDPDASGEATTDDNDVLVVWNQIGAGIRGRQVQVPSSGDPVNLASFSVSTDADDSKPAISQSGGPTGRHLVAWERYFASPAPGDHDILVRLYTRNGTALTGEQLVASTPGPDEEDPAVDGDGTRWAVVYEKQAVIGDGDNDIFGRIATFTGASMQFTPTEVAIENAAGDDEVDPCVGFTGEVYVIGYSDEVTALDYDALIDVRDPFTLAVCELELGLETGTRNASHVEVATQWSGSAAPDSSDDLALVVWESLNTTTFDGDIRAWRFHADAGVVSDLGGGCGDGGKAWATCAMVANSGFTHRLTDADGLAPAFLIFGFEPYEFPCGSCLLVPDPFSAILIATTTNVYGEAAISTAIPNDLNLIGAQFIDQWAVVPGLSACAAIGADLSNAIQVEIQ